METVPLLVCSEGSVAGQRFVVTAEGLRLGREATNEIRIEDAGVSRQHARVLLHNGAVWVQDAGSRNGIFVNGQRVPDHRQMKEGDQLLVGKTTFTLHYAEASSAAPARPQAAARPAAGAPPRAPRAVAAPGWKAWPFVVAAVFTVGCIGCIGLRPLIGGGAPASDAPVGAGSPAPGPTYSLASVLADEPGPSPAGAPSVKQALEIAAGADADAARARLPDPPPGVGLAELLDRGQLAFDSGRLNEALVAYQQATKLDPACAICGLRVPRLEADIASKAQQQFDAGLRHYDALQYEDAVGAFSTVLMLVPDAGDPRHQQALAALDRARQGAAGRP
jgi:hypothetical protein